MDSGFGNNKAMYRWMADNTRTGHIGTLTKFELISLIKLLHRKARIHGNNTRTVPPKQRWWES